MENSDCGPTLKYSDSMKKTIIFTFSLLCAAVTAPAQNLDPTVEVSRVYEGKLIDSDKPYYRMAVPDSVERFNLTFDYSVSDSPYKGTDSFRPYIQDLKPDAAPYLGKSLFLRAGAGYTLHPVADVVWSPEFRIPFRMSIYGHHRSYAGRYRDIALKETQAGSYRLARNGKERYKGYETETSAGVNGRTDWKGGFFSFDAGYYGIASKDLWAKLQYDAFRTDFRVASLKNADRYFLYDVNLGYSYGASASDSRLSRSLGQYQSHDVLHEHDVRLAATLGPMLSREQGVLVDVGLDDAVYGGYLSSYAGDFSVTPKYVFSKGRWNLDLGVKFAALFNNDATGNPAIAPMHKFKGQWVYPAINIDFEAIRSYLDIYLKVDGGNDINRYSDLLQENRHLAGADFNAMQFRYLDNTVNRVTASIGLKGNISSRFGYDFSAGYSNMENALLWGIHIPENDTDVEMHPLLGYASYQSFAAALKCYWHSEDFRLDASLCYDPEWGIKVRSVAQTPSSEIFLPSEFSMNLNAVYNWKKRIYVGLHCEAASGSDGVSGTLGQYGPVRLPGWVDLGLSAEYRFTRKLSFWLYGGNLLNMTVQRVPLYAERGISCTLGVTFCL